MASTTDLDARLLSFEEDMAENMRAVERHAGTLTHVQCAHPSISTMTILVRTRPCTQGPGEEDKIDLAALVACFDEPSFQPSVLGRPLNVKEPNSRVTRTGKVRKTFYNQISVWYADENSKKNIKVFRNGNLHITGEKNPGVNIAIAKDVCRVLEQCFGKAREVYDFDVQMVNTNFRVSIGLVLARMRDAISKNPDIVKASYDPETYPGLNCKFRTDTGRDASVLVFNSGHVIITGIKKFTELLQAYAFVTKFIDDHSEAVRRQTFVASP